MIIWIILTVLLAGLIWLMVAPIECSINSFEEAFILRWKGIAKAKLYFTKDDLELQTDVLFITKKWHPLHPRKLQENEEKEKSSARKKFPKRNLIKYLPVLKTFKVKKLYLNVDTDDYVTNSYLFPVFFGLSNLSMNRELKINYNGHFDCLLLVENRLCRIGWAFISKFIS